MLIILILKWVLPLLEAPKDERVCMSATGVSRSEILCVY